MFKSIFSIVVLVCLFSNTGGSAGNPKIASPVLPGESEKIVAKSQPIEFAISSTDQDVEIYYTTDGKDPKTSGALYVGPFQPRGRLVTLKAIAVKEGYPDSDIVEQKYSMPSIDYFISGLVISKIKVGQKLIKGTLTYLPKGMTANVVVKVGANSFYKITAKSNLWQVTLKSKLIVGTSIYVTANCNQKKIVFKKLSSGSTTINYFEHIPYWAHASTKVN